MELGWRREVFAALYLNVTIVPTVRARGVEQTTCNVGIFKRYKVVLLARAIGMFACLAVSLGERRALIVPEQVSRSECASIIRNGGSGYR